MSALLLRAIRNAQREARSIRRDARASLGHVPPVGMAVQFWLDGPEGIGPAGDFDALVELEQRLVIAAFRRAYVRVPLRSSSPATAA